MSIKLKGSTDGSVTLQAPADTSPTGTDKTLILPTGVGSAGQVLKNGSTAGTLEFADGGKILQVKQTHLTTTSSQALSAETKAEISGLSVDITPVSSTSDMLVFVRWNGEFSTTTNYNCLFGVRRDSTDLGDPATSGNRTAGMAIISQGFFADDANSTPDSAYYSFLDTTRSSGTSQITYKATIQSTPAQTLYNQTSAAATNTNDYELVTSNIMVMEVAA